MFNSLLSVFGVVYRIAIARRGTAGFWHHFRAEISWSFPFVYTSGDGKIFLRDGGNGEGYLSPCSCMVLWAVMHSLKLK